MKRTLWRRSLDALDSCSGTTCSTKPFDATSIEVNFLGTIQLSELRSGRVQRALEENGAFHTGRLTKEEATLRSAVLFLHEYFDFKGRGNAALLWSEFEEYFTSSRDTAFATRSGSLRLGGQAQQTQTGSGSGFVERANFYIGPDGRRCYAFALPKLSRDGGSDVGAHRDAGDGDARSTAPPGSATAASGTYWAGNGIVETEHDDALAPEHEHEHEHEHAAPSEPEVEPSVACVSEVASIAASVAVSGDATSRLHKRLLRADGGLLRAAEEKLYFTPAPTDAAASDTTNTQQQYRQVHGASASAYSLAHLLDFGGGLRVYATDVVEAEGETEADSQHSTSVACGPDAPMSVGVQAEAAIQRARERRKKAEGKKIAEVEKRQRQRAGLTLDSLFRDNFFLSDSLCGEHNLATEEAQMHRYAPTPEDFTAVHLVNEEGTAFSFYMA